MKWLLIFYILIKQPINLTIKEHVRCLKNNFFEFVNHIISEKVFLRSWHKFYYNKRKPTKSNETETKTNQIKECYTKRIFVRKYYALFLLYLYNISGGESLYKRAIRREWLHWVKMVLRLETIGKIKKSQNKVSEKHTHAFSGS